MPDPLVVASGVVGFAAWRMRRFGSFPGLQPHALATAGYREPPRCRKSLTCNGSDTLDPLLQESFSRVPVRLGLVLSVGSDRSSPCAQTVRGYRTLTSVSAIYCGNCTPTYLDEFQQCFLPEVRARRADFRFYKIYIETAQHRPTSIRFYIHSLTLYLCPACPSKNRPRRLFHHPWSVALAPALSL